MRRTLTGAAVKPEPQVPCRPPADPAAACVMCLFTTYILYLCRSYRAALPPVCHKPSHRFNCARLFTERSLQTARSQVHEPAADGFHWATQIQPITDLGGLPAKQVWSQAWTPLTPALGVPVLRALEAAGHQASERLLTDNEAERAASLERARVKATAYEAADRSGAGLVDWSKAPPPPDAEEIAEDRRSSIAEELVSRPKLTA